MPVDPADPRVMTGRIWGEFCETLREAGALVTGPGVPASALERAVGFRYLTQFLAAGINLCVANADPDHPELTRMMDLNMRWGLDSPDCLYLVAPLRGDATYRLWGDPGSANHLDIQVNTGHPAEGRIEAIRTLASIRGDEIERSTDGSIELLLGGDERAGSWLSLAADATQLQIRQNFYDWEHERPADFLIERVGGPVTKPPTRSDQIAQRIDLLRSWLAKGGALWEKLSQAMLSMPPNSVVAFAPAPGAAHTGLEGQIYCQGNFCCARDEAVIFEFVPPPCRHWSISLANRYWEAIDFATRQSSLNGFQAQLDAAGTFRAVIAHEDPGVPNWLDTGGHESGTLFGRFILAQGELAQPTSSRLKLSSLREALPFDTPVVTAAQRGAALRRRREAVWRRYRR